MPWRCARCGVVHTQNVGKCRNCNHTVFDTVSYRELVDNAEGIDTPQAMNLDRGPATSTSPKPDGSPDVNPDGSIADHGIEPSDTVSRSQWQEFSIEKWWIKSSGAGRFAVQIIGVGLVLLTAYNLLLYPVVGVEIWFGYRDFFVEAVSSFAPESNPLALRTLSDIVVMVCGMIATWFA